MSTTTREWLKENYPEVVTANGFDEALIGVAKVGSAQRRVVCYDFSKCAEILVAQGMSPAEAEEYLENTLGANIGDFTPVFLLRYHP